MFPDLLVLEDGDTNVYRLALCAGIPCMHVYQRTSACDGGGVVRIKIILVRIESQIAHLPYLCCLSNLVFSSLNAGERKCSRLNTHTRVNMHGMSTNLACGRVHPMIDELVTGRPVGQMAEAILVRQPPTASRAGPAISHVFTIIIQLLLFNSYYTVRNYIVVENAVSRSCARLIQGLPYACTE